jgi:thiamine biosynthesis lipoprotein
MPKTVITREVDCWRGQFEAMASPCEVLMEVESETLAFTILEAVVAEAARIEQKYSRYLPHNIIAQINSANGDTVEVDDETARMLDFADQLYQMSDGLFDITSGVLRTVWQFDGSDRLADKELVALTLERVGWHKCAWKNRRIQLEPGMEIDLGGIGKEYAVDRCSQIVRDLTDKSVLINFGGDLTSSCERQQGKCWSVGRLITGDDEPVALFRLYKGALATSGDRNRFLLRNGIRYSHILNPKTGWPVENAPHSVSVAANTCVEAGMFSTLAMLQGNQAEDFLKQQGKPYWID